MMKRVAYGLALAVVVTGIVCSSGEAASYRDPWVSFRYPDSWRVHHWDIPSSGVKYIAWLSNARLHDPCIRRRTGYRCGRPIDRLPSRGVLVTWLLSVLPGADRARSGIWIARPGPCGEIGADETISRRFRAYFVEACIRGPGMTLAEQQVRAMLASARFPTP
jgi:hypothetical protein